MQNHYYGNFTKTIIPLYFLSAASNYSTAKSSNLQFILTEVL